MIFAFAAVYLTWGGTFLFIRYAVETIPPFVLTGVRHTIAGALLYVWARLRGDAKPDPRHWLGAIFVGALLLLGGNTLVSWAEQRVPSSVTALMLATTPVWMVLLEWLRGATGRPNLKTAVGVTLGLAGMVLLVGPGRLGGERVDSFGAFLLVIAALSWTVGSVYSRSVAQAKSLVLNTAMQMLGGGILILLVGALAGEWKHFQIQNISLLSAISLGYLIVFGSIVGYTCYNYLLRVTTISRVSTYAYVNPMVAVFLGWAVAGEKLTPRMGLAAAIIVVAVMLVVSSREPVQTNGTEKISPAAKLAPAMERTGFSSD
ncbi:MAG: EamA family transporter [Acidobacteria bacterium]|nr:EamA family transporter [Acidobacteriota bacterium]